MVPTNRLGGVAASYYDLASLGTADVIIGLVWPPGQSEPVRVVGPLWESDDYAVDWAWLRLFNDQGKVWGAMTHLVVLPNGFGAAGYAFGTWAPPVYAVAEVVTPAEFVESYGLNTDPVSALGVNASGVLVGARNVIVGGAPEPRYFVGSPAVAADEVDFEPRAINDAGWVLGRRTTPTAQNILWRRSPLREIVLPAGDIAELDASNNLHGLMPDGTKVMWTTNPATRVSDPATGTYVAIAYVRPVLPPGWTSDLKIVPGSPGLKLGTGTFDDPATPAADPETRAFLLVSATLAVDANRDGTVSLDSSDTTTHLAPYRFWLNDDDDNADGTADANDDVINGAADLDDFYPVFLDLKSLVAAMPPSSSVKYKLRQDDGAVNFVYTNLTRATAFSYVGGSLATGFGPSFNQASASATVQQVTASGVELSSDFLNRIASQDQGVLLMDGRQMSDKPLVLQVEKDSSVVAEVRLEKVAIRLGKLWETSNKANQIFDRTRKDDSTGNLAVLEIENDSIYAGPGYEAVYAVPRNNLYVVADPIDNMLKVSLDLGIPATSRSRFLVAAWDGTAKVTGSDAALPADASQPANLHIAAASTAATKEYQLKLGVDANGNRRLDEGEATPLEIYRRQSTGELRFATVKGISNARYEEHKTTLVGKIGFLGQSQPGFPAKYARSFLALLYYKGDMDRIQTTVRPEPIAGTQQLDAFANGVGFSEWLTHNSGAMFTDAGQATIQDYRWIETSEVAEFFASRTPFALETSVNNSQGYFEFQTTTGAALKAFYDAQVKTSAEQTLQNSSVGTTLTFPLEGGWYEFPRAESPNLLKSTSPGNWVTPSTQIVGADDGYSGFGALLADIVAGTDQFKDFDAFGTVGRGRVRNPRYQITVKKEDTGIIFTNIEYKVSAVRFTCDVEDLYDFNYEDGELPSHAAAMQLGWGKGANGPARDQGKIFRHQIRLDKTYVYPFDQAVIMIPGP